MHYCCLVPPDVGLLLLLLLLDDEPVHLGVAAHGEVVHVEEVLQVRHSPHLLTSSSSSS